jgi:D-alanyl-lipoteichoic acid acyltransferase DltB (MBOAT superfamily)
MLFNTIPFFLFFTAVYFIYWNIGKKLKYDFLILAGAAFYFYYSPLFLLHFLIVISINYFFYYQIYNGNKSLFVKLAVIFNLLNLGFFKYFYFFTGALSDITGSLFFKDASEGRWIHITLPLAISFYSFQMIACAVDTYRNTADEELLSFKKYLLFVLFFPVLIAGPIMRKKDFFPNLEREVPQKDDVYKASFLMMSGLIKKILLADPVATIINPVFANPNEYTAFSLFMGGILYTIQVYADFSGLTDMARSVAYFLGFQIPENFYAPFFATSGRELWKKWHVTLSFWLMEYIYFPLGGSRAGEMRTYLNLIITMTLGGFWHGADYTFVVWGFYWGSILCVERYLEEKKGLPLTPQKSFPLKLFKAMIIYVLFSISGLMFRSNNTQSMVDLFVGLFTNSENYLRGILAVNGSEWLVSGMELVQTERPFLLNTVKSYESVAYMYLAFLFFHFVQYKPEALDRFKKYNLQLVLLLGVITIFLLTTLSHDGDSFIYTTF